MTLAQASTALLAAIEAGDLAAIAQALAQREIAIRDTQEPTQADLDAGERARAALQALQQRWAFESARLTQVQHGFGYVQPSPDPQIVCRG